MPKQIEEVSIYQLTAAEVAATDEDLVYEYSRRREFRLCFMNSQDREKMLDTIVTEQGIKGGWFYEFESLGFPIGPYTSYRDAQVAAETEAPAL